MSRESEELTVSIKILDYEFRVECPSNRIQSLEDAAQYLNHKIYDVRDHNGNKSISPENLVTIAAINISDELITLEKKHEAWFNIMNNRVSELLSRIEQLLGESS